MCAPLPPRNSSLPVIDFAEDVISIRTFPIASLKRCERKVPLVYSAGAVRKRVLQNDVFSERLGEHYEPLKKMHKEATIERKGTQRNEKLAEGCKYVAKGSEAEPKGSQKERNGSQKESKGSQK